MSGQVADTKENQQKCPLQHCCANFAPNSNGNCVSKFSDVLDCFVEKEEADV